jgi:hypothetical protein
MSDSSFAYSNSGELLDDAGERRTFYGNQSGMYSMQINNDALGILVLTDKRTTELS